jgi:cytochrome c-type biogenesis protein CcmE
MVKRAVGFLFMAVVVFAVSLPAFAQGSAKQARVEGSVMRSNPEKSTLTVRVRDTESERTVYYDASTKWVSQYHADKKVNTIEPSDVKDGDQVICMGTYDDKKDFHATAISKRLSHSPQ